MNGEGVVSQITASQSDQGDKIGDLKKEEKLTALCGNDKLLNRHSVDIEFNDFRMNMESLEKEGKTVVCLVIDGYPRLLISLEEAHTAKKEALGVVNYIRNVLKL